MTNFASTSGGSALYGSIYQALNAQTTQVLDLSDILRSQWVMAVSSLDYYVHELVRLGMLEAYRGERIQTDSFLRFQITLSGALQNISSLGSDDWLEDQIKSSHGHVSFQNPENIANAIRLVSDAQLWNAIAVQLNVTPQYVGEELRLIVDRRNKIAHESDVHPFGQNRLWPIDFAVADEVVSFIERLVEAMHAVVA